MQSYHDRITAAYDYNDVMIVTTDGRATDSENIICHSIVIVIVIWKHHKSYVYQCVNKGRIKYWIAWRDDFSSEFSTLLH